MLQRRLEPARVSDGILRKYICLTASRRLRSKQIVVTPEVLNSLPYIPQAVISSIIFFIIINNHNITVPSSDLLIRRYCIYMLS